jgi:hypothetical protein
VKLVRQFKDLEFKVVLGFSDLNMALARAREDVLSIYNEELGVNPSSFRLVMKEMYFDYDRFGEIQQWTYIFEVYEIKE